MSIREECGVFGVIAPRPADVGRLAYYGLYALQHRGQESCGIVVNDDGIFASRKDLGLVGESDRMENSHLAFLPIREIHDIFVCSPEYLEKLQEQSAENGDLLTQGTFLLLNKNNVTRQYMDKHMLLQNITMEHQVEVTTMDLLIDFARIGLGIACVIGEFVQRELKEGSLVECSIREPVPSRRIGFAYPRSARPSAAMSAFLEQVSKA